MPQIINNVDSLKKLRGQLHQASVDLDQVLKQTFATVEKVHETWKDSQFEQFKEKFDKDCPEVIKPLADQIEKFQAEPLARLEKNLRIYLGRR